MTTKLVTVTAIAPVLSQLIDAVSSAGFAASDPLSAVAIPASPRELHQEDEAHGLLAGSQNTSVCSDSVRFDLSANRSGCASPTQCDGGDDIFGAVASAFGETPNRKGAVRRRSSSPTMASIGSKSMNARQESCTTIDMGSPTGSDEPTANDDVAVNARAMFTVTGMTCASCVSAIQSGVLATPGIGNVKVALLAERAGEFADAVCWLECCVHLRQFVIALLLIQRSCLIPARQLWRALKLASRTWVMVHRWYHNSA